MRIINMMMIVGMIDGTVIFHTASEAPSTTALSQRWRHASDGGQIDGLKTGLARPWCRRKIGRNHSALVRSRLDQRRTISRMVFTIPAEGENAVMTMYQR
jgi:hypothetical protein